MLHIWKATEPRFSCYRSSDTNCDTACQSMIDPPYIPSLKIISAAAADPLKLTGTETLADVHESWIYIWIFTCLAFSCRRTAHFSTIPWRMNQGITYCHGETRTMYTTKKQKTTCLFLKSSRHVVTRVDEGVRTTRYQSISGLYSPTLRSSKDESNWCPAASRRTA